MILESLSKLSIDDESKVMIAIKNDFDIEGHFYYLTIVIKNLIDNAMKYSDSFPINIVATDSKLSIQKTMQKSYQTVLYTIFSHSLENQINNKVMDWD